MYEVAENSDQMYFSLTAWLGHVSACVRAGKSDADEGDSIWHLEKKNVPAHLPAVIWVERYAPHHKRNNRHEKNSLSCVGISKLKTSLQGMMSIPVEDSQIEPMSAILTRQRHNYKTWWLDLPLHAAG